ncbi:MAG: hypothetical protein Q4A05_03880 [Ruminococcus sp.]|nr:hypothetical protein [Ruminococcus sp.]
MKSYSEIEANAFKKAEQRISDRKRRRLALIRRTSALTLATAAVLGIGIFTHAMKPPKKPTPSSSGIVAETETTSAVTAVAPTSTGTAASQTVATVQTTAATTAATTASARQTVEAVRTTTLTSLTTAGTSLTTSVSAPMTTTIAQQTESEIPEIALETTQDIPEMPTSESFGYDDMLEANFFLIRLSGNEMLVRGSAEAYADSLAEQIGEITLRPTYYADSLPEDLSAQLYNMIGVSSKEQVAVRFTGSEKYIIYNVVETEE